LLEYYQLHLLNYKTKEKVTAWQSRKDRSRTVISLLIHQRLFEYWSS
jgi:hypothetical protein